MQVVVVVVVVVVVNCIVSVNSVVIENSMNKVPKCWKKIISNVG